MNIQFRRRSPNALWLVLLIVGCFIGYLIWYNGSNRVVEPLTYSRFLQLVSVDMVDSVAIQDQHVHGILKNGTQFQTCVIPSDRLWDELRVHNVHMNVYPL